jgi:hypothetical protein
LSFIDVEFTQLSRFAANAIVGESWMLVSDNRVDSLPAGRSPATVIAAAN